MALAAMGKPCLDDRPHLIRATALYSVLDIPARSAPTYEVHEALTVPAPRTRARAMRAHLLPGRMAGPSLSLDWAASLHPPDRRCPNNALFSPTKTSRRSCFPLFPPLRCRFSSKHR